MRYCSICKKEKEDKEFYVNARGYVYTYCKDCAKEMSKEWARKNRTRASQIWARWRANHADAYNASRRALRNNPQKKLAMDGRTYITHIVSGRKKLTKFLNDIIGFKTREEFVNYLKSTNTTEYSFENDYGKVLVIDHIVPCSAFDLTDAEQYKKCFHHSNLRLITRKENAEKYNKIIT